MRMLKMGTALALSLIACAGAPARADDEAIKKELQAIYNKIIESVKKKDIGHLGYVASDYQEKTVFGQKFNRSQVEARLKENLARTESVDNLKLTVIHIATRANHAVVLVKREITAKVKDPDGKTHVFTSDGHALDIWTKTAKGWQLRQTDELSVHQTLDGKPLVPEKKKPAPLRPGRAPKK